MEKIPQKNEEERKRAATFKTQHRWKLGRQEV